MSQQQLVQVDNVLQEMQVQNVIKNRKINLAEEVTRESIFKCIYYLEKLEKMDILQNILMKDRKPIEIVIDSYGGEIWHGNALISIILSMRDKGYKIITTVNSIACSMGFTILVVGSKRRALRYSTMLCHQPSGGTYGTLQAINENTNELNRLWEIFKDIIQEHTNISEERLEEMKRCKEDWILNPKQALELGVIDEII